MVIILGLVLIRRALKRVSIIATKSEILEAIESKLNDL